jgi:hypothetical protein
MNELNDEQNVWLSRYKMNLYSWKGKKERSRYYLLTKSEIDNFNILCRKGFTGENLTDSERRSKSDAKGSMKFAIDDIAQLMRMHYPQPYPNDLLGPYSDDEWRDILQLDNISLIVRELVGRFGENYALRLANELTLGLKQYESRHGRIIEVDIPIIKRVGSEIWGSIDYGKPKRGRKKKIRRPINPQ